MPDNISIKESLQFVLQSLIIDLNGKLEHNFLIPDIITKNMYHCARIKSTFLGKEYPHVIIKCDICKIDLRIIIDYMYRTNGIYITITDMNHKYYINDYIKYNYLETYLKNKKWRIPTCSNYIIESIME